MQKRKKKKILKIRANPGNRSGASGFVDRRDQVMRG